MLDVGVIYELCVQDDDALEKLGLELVVDVVECLALIVLDDEVSEDVHTPLEVDDDELDECDIVIVEFKTMLIPQAMLEVEVVDDYIDIDDEDEVEYRVATQVVITNHAKKM